MRQSLNSNGVYAAQSEQYKLPIESQKQYQTADRAWWAHPLVIVFLTIVFSLMDALVLYSILDMATTQSELLGYVMSFAVGEKVSSPYLVSKIIAALLTKCESTVGKMLPARRAIHANAAPQQN